MADDVRVETAPVGVVLRPPGHAATVILHLADQPDSYAAAARLATRTGCAVVCAEHRLRFPAALEDVHAAYRYCLDTGPVVVTGERMGAFLAAALLVRLRDTAAPLPRGAVLVSALLDLTMQAKSLLLNATADPAFDVPELRRRVSEFVAGMEPTDALLSPVYANLHGLHPVQLLVAGTDPLLDDSLTFAARAARSHVTVDLRVWQDAESLQAQAPAAMAKFVATCDPATRITA